MQTNTVVTSVSMSVRVTCTTEVGLEGSVVTHLIMMEKNYHNIFTWVFFRLCYIYFYVTRFIIEVNICTNARTDAVSPITSN